MRHTDKHSIKKTEQQKENASGLKSQIISNRNISQ